MCISWFWLSLLCFLLCLSVQQVYHKSKGRSMVHPTFHFLMRLPALWSLLLPISTNILMAFHLNLFLIKCLWMHFKIMQGKVQQRKTSWEVYDYWPDQKHFFLLILHSKHFIVPEKNLPSFCWDNYFKVMCKQNLTKQSKAFQIKMSKRFFLNFIISFFWQICEFVSSGAIYTELVRSFTAKILPSSEEMCCICLNFCMEREAI